MFEREMAKAKKHGGTVKFYDSNSGNLLFQAPVGRSHDDFWTESQAHGWPSFRDEEVNWEYVCCLRNGEAVSIHGTHLVGGRMLDWFAVHYRVLDAGALFADRFKAS